MVATRIYRGALCVIMMLVLVGCMQALQTDNPTGTQPVPSPTSVSTHVAETLAVSDTHTGILSTDVPSNTPTSMMTSVPIPTQTSTATQTATNAPTTPAATVLPSPTPSPTATPTPSPTFTPTPEVTIVLPTRPRLSYQEQWRQQQTQREVFPTLRAYTTTGSELRWYDPINQQHVVIGTLSGQFDAQARFVLAGSHDDALEVPYHINTSYGLTAISSSLVQRMNEAGYTEWVEAYIVLTENVQPQEIDTNKG